MKTTFFCIGIIAFSLLYACTQDRTDHYEVHTTATKLTQPTDTLPAATSNSLEPDDEEPRKDRQQWLLPQ